MSGLAARATLRRADYWTRSIAQHDAAHIVTSRSRGEGIPRYFFACGNSATGGRVTGYLNAQHLQLHVCVGCTKGVIP